MESTRVKLIRELTPKLPLNSLGTVIDGPIDDRPIVLVHWDYCNVDLPMYRSEIEEVKE